MSSVSALSSATSTTTATSSVSSALSSTDFLQLLCVQLQNQNPLDPTDSDEFMSELVSYASLDQQSEMNEQLGDLVTAVNSLLSANALGYVGRTVEAEGDTATLTSGSASWGYSLDSTAASTTITVKDSSGATVYSTTGETSAGDHTFTWDGTTNSGSLLTSGDYTISVSATGSSGSSVDVTTSVIGEVTGVDSSSGTPMLQIGNQSFALSDVLSIKA